jgi:hypothetical protein
MFARGVLEHLRLDNRRAYRVLEHLAALEGLPMMVPDDEGRYGACDDRERTMACVHAAHYALGLAVDLAVKASRRGLRAFYRAYTVQSAPPAVLLMAHGLAATSARMVDPAGVEAQQSARELLKRAFWWDAEPETFVTSLAEQVDPETPDGLLPARVMIAATAIDVVGGTGCAARMPEIASYFDDDGLSMAGYSSGLAWQSWSKQAVTGWYQASDPDRLRRKERLPL